MILKLRSEIIKLILTWFKINFIRLIPNMVFNQIKNEKQAIR